MRIIWLSLSFILHLSLPVTDKNKSPRVKSGREDCHRHGGCRCQRAAHMTRPSSCVIRVTCSRSVRDIRALSVHRLQLCHPVL